MLKDTKSDTQKKGPSGMAKSDGFPGNITQKKENNIFIATKEGSGEA